MSVTTPTPPTVTEPYAVRRASSLRRTTVVAGLVAAAFATAVAAAVHVADVSFEVDGEMIPLAGFAPTTFLGAVIELTLVALHVLAAAIVVPALVRHAHH